MFFKDIDHIGVVAQLVEHLLCKQGVAGSNPAGSTIYDSIVVFSLISGS